MKRFLTVAALVALTLPVAAQDKAADVMKQTREALGGNKLAQLKGLTLEGPFRREMGERQMAGTLALTLELPDKMHRSEDTEMMGGMSIERTSVLAGDKSWEDMQNRGGMGGGMQIVMRRPARAGAQSRAARTGAPAPVPHRVQALPARVHRRRRAHADLRRASPKRPKARPTCSR